MSAAAVAGVRRPLRAVVADYVALTKPRIIVLLEITALGAMVMAARGWPGTTLVLATLAGGWLGAAGANAINCWFDRDIDLAMGRTRHRPLPSGRIDPAHALVFGVGLGVASFVLLTAAVNLTAALLTQFALLFYVLIYTVWLKRSSAQNIVIGGAAGAIPPMVGWAAVTGGIDATAIMLFAVIFYWTPPHFWALSLLVRRDYQRASVPMLPVATSDRHTRVLILLYTVVMVVVTLLPFLSGALGYVYLAAAVTLDGIFLALAVRVARGGGARSARQLFYYSLVYLALLFATMAADRVLVG
jgi:protoheme IX farnesyltransferase